MAGFIVPFLIGIICIALGFLNMTGNISSLHSYHRRRVSEEDRIPFGKKVGLGTVICGSAVTNYSVLSAITFYTKIKIFILIGSALLIAGLAIGIGLSFAAMIKYNKGIF